MSKYQDPDTSFTFGVWPNVIRPPVPRHRSTIGPGRTTTGLLRYLHIRSVETPGSDSHLIGLSTLLGSRFGIESTTVFLPTPGHRRRLRSWDCCRPLRWTGTVRDSCSPWQSTYQFPRTGLQRGAVRSRRGLDRVRRRARGRPRSRCHATPPRARGRFAAKLRADPPAGRPQFAVSNRCSSQGVDRKCPPMRIDPPSIT